jgi:hypothetical protein
VTKPLTASAATENTCWLINTFDVATMLSGEFTLNMAEHAIENCGPATTKRNAVRAVPAPAHLPPADHPPSIRAASSSS